MSSRLIRWDASATSGPTVEVGGGFDIVEVASAVIAYLKAPLVASEASCWCKMMTRPGGQQVEGPVVVRSARRHDGDLPD